MAEGVNAGSTSPIATVLMNNGSPVFVETSVLATKQSQALPQRRGTKMRLMSGSSVRRVQSLQRRRAALFLTIWMYW